MKNYFLLAFSILFLSLGINAFAKDMSVNDVLKNLTSHANTVGEFVQEKSVIVNGKKRLLKSSGTFIISSKGIVWNTLKPVRSVSTITDGQIILTNSDGRRSVLDIPENNDFSSFSASFSSIFKGNMENLNTNFNVVYEDSSSGGWKIFLLPKNENLASFMKKIELEGVNLNGDSRLDSVTLFQQNGEDIKYTLTKQQVKEILSDEEKYYFEAK
ncbi:MAG: hypothetical protein II070_00495 [Treponema sp.]|jgi:hypothetical protein|nr:hypothetical protein [Treponema sp.]MBQ4024224.1 hypothetical protein [Treponema sp.]